VTDTLRLALTVQLEQSPYLRVVPSQQVREALVYMKRRPDDVVTPALAMDMCQRLGSRVVLTGSIAGLGGRYVIGLEGTHVESPNGGKDGFGPVHVSFTATKSFFVPKICNHCKATPCTQVCPVGASYRTKDGVVMVDAKRCIGCAYCVQACPYGSRFLSPVTHTAEKCTWCYHRITKGLKPACVTVCPTGTRQFGDMLREDDPVRQAIEHERVSVMQPHLLTEPQCFYIGLDKEVR
jgi:Fe-S-cluster-containing dehydrogenase component